MTLHPIMIKLICVDPISIGNVSDFEAENERFLRARKRDEPESGLQSRTKVTFLLS